MKRSPLRRGSLKRGRFRRLYDPNEEARALYKKGMPLICAMCGATPKVGVPVDAHHVIPQRLIRRYVGGLGLDEADTILLLRRLLWDKRNRLPLDRRCHDMLERSQVRLSGDLVGEPMREFARELGLDWWLEKHTEAVGPEPETNE